MKGTFFKIAGLALTLVAMSVCGAYAGGGGAGTPIDTFALDCYLVNGANPPHVVALDDQFFPGEQQRTNVAVGPAKLLCTPSTLTITSNHTPQAVGTSVDHLMCYQTTAKGAVPNVLKQVADPFGTQTVLVGAPQFTCVGAFKCDVGGPCPAP